MPSCWRWSTAFRSGRDVSVILLDVDKFKLMNDTCGHKHGNKVLIANAKALMKSIRQGDVLARWGGEEFVVVLLPKTNIQEAVALAERLRIATADNFLYPTKQQGRNRVNYRRPGEQTTTTA